MAKAPTPKTATTTPSEQPAGVANSATPAATQPPAPQDGEPAAPAASQPPTPQDGEIQTRYRVLSAIKYGGQVHPAGAELSLPDPIAVTLVGRVEEIG